MVLVGHDWGGGVELDHLARLEVESIGPVLHDVQDSQPTAIGRATSSWIETLRPWSGASERS